MTEPARIPRTKNRWSRKNTANGTAAWRKAPAVSRCSNWPNCPVWAAMTTVDGAAFWLAPIIGGVVGALLYLLIAGDRETVPTEEALET